MQAVAAEVIVEIIIEREQKLPDSLSCLFRLKSHVKSKSFIVFEFAKQPVNESSMNALQEAKKNGEIIAFSCI